MNKNMLAGIMKMNGDTQAVLASDLGISLGRLNAKINETGGAEFTQREISRIKERYRLDPGEVDKIFFASNVS
ncbi:MAG: hypothetical protein K6C09_08450 [Oscillospiraceae bacterium]|nr:hypothetical protein [Oscillospiraceae bacterium]